tara:strand:- start:9923 stop:11557 length:1635 start_codon:yes stop_codon:yes gene_type:complete
MENSANSIKQIIEKGRVSNRKTLKPNEIAQLGKLPPQALDLEEAVLGALMLDKEAVSEVIDILAPDSFYDEKHQRIFAAIQSLFNKTEPIDILTVTNELKERGELELVGGAYAVAQLTNRIASAANIEYHARIIVQKAIQRKLIHIASQIIHDAYDDTIDVLELLDKAEKELFTVSEGNLRKNYDDMGKLIHKAIEQIQEAKNKSKDGGTIGVPSGFSALDKITAGWQPSDLIIVAARPAMGKTSFVLSLARNAAVDFNMPVAFFSLEMSSIQLVTRLISAEALVDSEKLRSGNLRDDEMQQIITKVNQLAQAPIYIDDTPGLSVFELRAKARRLKQQHDIKLLIVDYLQLMTAGGADSSGNRVQEISTISRSLKIIAKELEIPVIALSQLSRSVETRGGDKKPQLSDLRESGSIEQDADIVQFIYRPEYYGITEDSEGNPLQGAAYILIQKNRHGQVCEVKLGWDANYARFRDFEDIHANPFLTAPADLQGDDGYATGSSMMPNTNFPVGGETMTVPSKMNDDTSLDDDEDFLQDNNFEDAPF